MISFGVIKKRILGTGIKFTVLGYPKKTIAMVENSSFLIFISGAEVFEN